MRALETSCTSARNGTAPRCRPASAVYDRRVDEERSPIEPGTPPRADRPASGRCEFGAGAHTHAADGRLPDDAPGHAPARDQDREGGPEAGLEAGWEAGREPGLETGHTAGRARWRASRSFDELCALGAAFLARRCAHFPGWGAPDPDEETDAILAPLLELHARGFLTVASQPAFEGPRGGRDVRQRAFVAGFARPDLALRLARAERIRVRVWFADGTTTGIGPGREEPEAMTTEDGLARVYAGHSARATELGLFEGEVGDEALRELSAAAYVTAWDPRFGRAEVLWRELSRLGAP